MVPFQIMQFVFTILVAIPCAGALLFLILRLSKSCVRSSTQLVVHCWAWVMYFLTGFVHSFYVVVRWKGADHIYNDAVFQLTIVFHMTFVFLLPWAVLLATVDRCISLRLPTYYSSFNGETMRIATSVVSICMIFSTWCWVYSLMVRIDASAYGSCFLVECFDSDLKQFIHKFLLYKVVFGFINLIISSVFIYFFWNYQKRGRGLDRIKNNLIFIILLAEFFFNVVPPLCYYILYAIFDMETINIFGPIIFACINLDGICSVLIYFISYKRKQKHFHSCKPRHTFSAQMKPIKSIQTMRSSPNTRANSPAKDQPTYSRAFSSS